MLNDTLPMAIEMDKILADAKKSKRQLTAEEKALVDKVNALVNEIVQVDSFEKLGAEKYQDVTYVRPALRHTKFAEMKVPVEAMARR